VEDIGLRTTSRRNQAMTLIELLVVLGLTALLAGIGYRLIIAAGQWSRIQQTQLEANRNGWASAQRIARDLRMALPPAGLGAAVWRGERGDATLIEAFNPETVSPEAADAVSRKSVRDDRLQFAVSPVGPSADVEGPSAVCYFLHRDKEGRIAGLARTVSPLGGTAEGEPPVIAPHVVSLGFEYLAADGKWLDQWTDAAAPKAVRVTVGSINRNATNLWTPTEFSTVIYLPAGTRITR